MKILSNLTGQTDARGCATGLAYDRLNRLTGKTFSNCAGTTPTIAYTYDASSATNSGIGRRTGVSDGSGATAWEYDLRGRLIHEAKTVVDPVGSLELGAYHTYRSYNPDNSLRQMVYPNMETVTFSYNPQGGLRRVYSLLNGATEDVTQMYVSDTTYAAAGQVQTRVLGEDAVTQSYTYYPWDEQGGRLWQLVTHRPGENPDQDLAYTYDELGNLTDLVDSVASETLAFTYDDLNRLVGTSGYPAGGYNETITYDPVTGNIASRVRDTTPATLAYDYNENHPHAVSELNGALMYTYDQNGNMVTRKYGGIDYSLVYNAENRLVEISGSNVSARYVYDGDGKRVLAVINGVRTVYIGGYFEAQTSASSMSAPTLTNYSLCHDNRCSRVYLTTIRNEGPSVTPVGMTGGNFGNTYYHTHQAAPLEGVTWRMYYGGQALRVQTGSQNELYYLLQDHLGSTVKAIPEEGSGFSGLSYSAWGETRDSYGTMPTKKQYTGQDLAEIGLYFISRFGV